MYDKRDISVQWKNLGDNIYCLYITKIQFIKKQSKKNREDYEQYIYKRLR
jgi:hypothetical protein